MEESEVYKMSIYRLVSWFRAKYPESLTNTGDAFSDPKLLTTQEKRKKEAAGLRVWSKPGRDTTKFNVDAAVARVSGEAGIGGVLRDENGRTLAVFSKAVFAHNVEMAEFLAIMEAFKIYDHLNMGQSKKNLIIESDSITACNWFNEPNQIPWGLHDQKQIMEFLKSKQPKVEVVKINRECNFIADNLAKAGINRSSPLVVFLGHEDQGFQRIQN